MTAARKATWRMKEGNRLLLAFSYPLVKVGVKLSQRVRLHMPFTGKTHRPYVRELGSRLGSRMGWTGPTGTRPFRIREAARTKKGPRMGRRTD